VTGEVGKSHFGLVRVFKGAAFIEAVTMAQNLPDSQVFRSKPGRGGGTYAHWQIAAILAK